MRLCSVTEGSASACLSRLEVDTTFYLIRHGESEGNAKGMAQGHFDAPLNANGREQAGLSAAWFAGLGVKRLFCSPLSRASDTARILSSSCRELEPERNPLFRELDVGMFSGRILEEMRIEHPEIYERYEEHSWDGVPGAESSGALYERAIACWDFLVREANASGGPVAAVTHGGLIQWLVRSTFGCRTWYPVLPTGNCGVFELDARRTHSEIVKLFWKKVNWMPYDQSLAKAQVF